MFVLSILYDDLSRALILTVTKGLNPQATGKVRMKVGEGLVVLALEKLAPTNAAFAQLSGWRPLPFNSNAVFIGSREKIP